MKQKHATPKKLSRDLASNWCVKQVMNDLLMITEEGKQRSRMMRLFIISAGRFLVSRNKFNL